MAFVWKPYVSSLVRECWGLSFSGLFAWFGFTNVCVVLFCGSTTGSKPSWEEGKKLLSDMKFMDRLRDYDKDNIPKRAIKDLQRYMNIPKFVPEEIRKVSEAATCLCMWVRAMVVYDKVAKNIEPKKEKLAVAEAELARTTEQLNKKKASLKAVLDRVAALKVTLEATMAKKAELEAQAQKCKIQLERAEKLLGGLGGEKIRWKAAADKLGKDMVNLVGNMMLSAGVVAYLGKKRFIAKMISRPWIYVSLLCYFLMVANILSQDPSRRSSVGTWWGSGSIYARPPASL